MEVSNHDDVSSVTFGSKQSHAATIDDSPEFFNVLSSSLYKHQKLAVVRETITNAWDAHIEAGIETPIKMWIDSDNILHIQDFGNGIPHELLGEVYVSYGKGTKRNDSAQTGGFGLGCKSPWAYVDSFNVTNCHNGLKSVSTMVKSSSQFQGKPGLISVVTDLPTQETGVTVSIQLKPQDIYEFTRLIKAIVYTGDIPCLFDDILLDTLGMPFEEGSVRFPTNKIDAFKALPHIGNNSILVRYGNVVYPLGSSTTSNEAYNYVYAQLDKVLTEINRSTMSYVSLLIQIPADSVSLLPSREGISETDFSLENLATHLNAALGQWIKDFNRGKDSAIHNALVKLYKEEPTEHLTLKAPCPLQGNTDAALDGITSFYEMGMTIGVCKGLTYTTKKQLCKTKVIQWAKKYTKLSKSDLKLLIAAINTEDIQLNIYNNYTVKLGSHTYIDMSLSWYNQRSNNKYRLPQMIHKFSKRMLPNKVREWNNLFVMGSNEIVHNSTLFQGLYRSILNTNLPDFILRLSKPTVVLSTNKATIHDRLSARNEPTFGSYIVHMVSPKKDEKDVMRAKLEKLSGINFVDLTQWTDDDKHLKPEPKRTAKVVTAKASKDALGNEEYLGLNTMINDDGEVLHLSWFKKTSTTVKITEPKYVTKITSKTSLYDMGLRHQSLFEKAVLKFGHVTAVVNNESTYKRLLKEGLLPFSETAELVMDDIIARATQVSKTITPKYNGSVQMAAFLIQSLTGKYHSQRELEYYLNMSDDLKEKLRHLDKGATVRRVIHYCANHAPRILPVRLSETTVDEIAINEVIHELRLLSCLRISEDKKTEIATLIKKLKTYEPSKAVVDLLDMFVAYERWNLLEGIRVTSEPDETTTSLIKVIFKNMKEKQ